MARRSVAVLNSSGLKVQYTTYKLAKADVDEKRAVWESQRCIRLLPSSDGVGWRTKKSGRYGPRIWQIERHLRSDEKGDAIRWTP